MSRVIRIILAALLICGPYAPAIAATGCNYPASLDSYSDKSTGSFLTVADVNGRSCAIEKLETGPLRPAKGSASAPAYSWMTDTNTGMDSLNADEISFITNGVERMKLNATDGLVPVGSTPIKATLGPGTWGSVGLIAFNNAGAPNTSFDLTAKSVTLRNSSNDSVIRHAPSTVTVSISTAGPTANGRDQAGAFSVSSWVHFYWIWNGTTLAGTVSTVAPTTGPTLPTGYTHWAYVGAVRLDGSGNMLSTRIHGNREYYTAPVSLCTGCSQTTESTVDVSAAVPSNALEYRISYVGGRSNDGDDLTFRVVTGVDYFTALSSAAATSQPYNGFVDFPYTGTTFYYLWVGSPEVGINMHLQSFVINNGGG